ncbi:MAG: ABC transporter ATP-binding protein [Burkholderiales bacterium]|nr:ABC transporter ATP-binding protein [Burkholderiales bacterium]
MPTSADHNSISVREVRKVYGGFEALSSISFEAARGSTVALLGPSGCGKTTMLRCIAGLEEAEAGAISIGGRVVFDSKRRINLKPEQRDLGVVFQSYAIWPHMTVAENVGFPLKLRRVPPAERTKRVERILEIVGLGQWRDSPSTQLSGGQQQRVALARAVVHEPRLVLFDEPLSNLDAQLREQMRLELKVLQERLGFTAVYVTHDQIEAVALAKQIVIMNRGRVEAVGAPEDIFERPPTVFVAKFLGLNMLEGVVTSIAPGDGGALTAELTLGGGERIRGLVMGGQSLQAGGRALACFRRESTRLGTGQGAKDAGDSVFGAAIKAKSYLGLHHEFLLAVDNAQIRAIGSASCAESDSVRVSIRPHECFIFAQPGHADAPRV